ncbi:MAG: 3-methyl-2-oxobutanoate hydroxymethyltransferase [Vicinamibacteria bacterium]
MTENRIQLPALMKKMADGRPLTMVTCYDYSMAHLVEKAEVDMVLVGDSLGMTMLGFEGTLPVTMEDMIRHTQAVRRGAPSRWLVGDMPYMSYQPSDETAVRNAGRFMAETGCDAVKLEGGRAMASRLRTIAEAGVSAMGHLGLTPQSASALGGFRVQGRSSTEAARIVEDARLLEEAGAFAILLEMVPDRVCKLVTERARIPIISLGSGLQAHGQLLIFHDMFGLYPRFKPRMAKQYADAGELILGGLRRYVAEVGERRFPQPENWFGIKDDEFAELERMLKSGLTHRGD